MKPDFKNLRTADVVRLLNSSSIGNVVKSHVVYRHHNYAASKVGDGRKIDLAKYAAWLFHARKETFKAGWAEKDYEAHKDAVNERSKEESKKSRDIAKDDFIRPPKNPERREACRNSFRLFCETYFQSTFSLAWSDDHLKVIGKIESAVLHGGLFAMAMPRGSGKTTLCEVACIWALFFNHRKFVALIGSDEDHASDMLDSIKSELENNDLLDEDFSEICGPIRALDGIHQRSSGQLYKGERTMIKWTSKKINLPVIEGSPASGSVIRVAGITGRVRGMKQKMYDGKTIRPSLVLLDDPQTDESARSPSQCDTREGILAGAILGLAGPGQKIAGLMTLTVVHPDDMADRILDRDKHPAWQGERTKMVYEFPKNEKLWGQYAKILADSLRADGDGREATEFYRQHREAMDDGAVVAWPARHNPDELSAVQHAMTLKFRNEAEFFAEYQNEPIRKDDSSAMMFGAEQVAEKINGYKKGQLPIATEQVVAHIDVQETLLYYVVAAIAPQFTVFVTDYGSWPDQKTDHFTLDGVRYKLKPPNGKGGSDAAIFEGLRALTDSIVGRDWIRDDGARVRISRCIVDANYKTDLVYEFCRQNKYGDIVMPGHGRYIGASSVPMSEYKKKPGEVVGPGWRIPTVQGKRVVRHVVYDANLWKSFLSQRITTPIGDAGSLTLYQASPSKHRMIGEHVTAEYSVRTEGRGRVVDEWKLHPRKPDNHLLDSLVGCMVAASMMGATTVGAQHKQAAPVKRLSAAEIAARRSHMRRSFA
jgi:hypothetical protein